jgi:glyoxylase-like metal-dependent hydrolase (beta-lactamase superfamily II)
MTDSPVSPVQVFRVEDTTWLSNLYLVSDRPGGSAVIIDTGAPVEPVLEEVRRLSVGVPYILNTHFHGDHVAGNEALARRLDARVAAHRIEVPSIPAASMPLEDGQVLHAGDLEIRVLHIPGHTAGQAAFLVNGRELFTGDTLFRRSVGGTVGPGASGFEDLRRSLLERLLALPDEVIVRPGHTLPSTIGEERRENLFLRVMLGLDPPGTGRCRAFGRPADLIVHARDYDGGTKAWVRFDENGQEATVPGSRVELS